MRPRRSMVVPSSLLFYVALASLPGDAAVLHFAANEGGNQNYFFQSPETAYHLRLTPSPHPKILFAFPAENSGILLTFDETRPENKGLQWTHRQDGPWSGAGGLRGGATTLGADRSAIVLTGTILDSIRLIRDAPIHAQRIADRRALDAALKLGAAEWIDTTLTQDSAGLMLTRRTLDGKNHYAARIRFLQPSRVTALDGGAYRIETVDREPLRLQINAGVDYASLTPIAPEELLAPRALAAYRNASAGTSPKQKRLREAIDRFRFLTYREKMLAGSHRFLTYFGRDTLITGFLAWDQLTPKAREAALRAVLDRVSPEGRVAHEEDIGGQAELDRVSEALRLAKAGDTAGAWNALRDLQSPIYDYKMIDGEPLLVIFAHRLLTDAPASNNAVKRFLNEKSLQGAPYGGILERVLKRVAEDAAPYAKARQALFSSVKAPSPNQLRELAKSLVVFRHPTVGDWRDSDAGNGFGPYSGNVNAILLPRALAVLSETAKAASIPPDRISSADIAALADAWSHAPEHFKVSLKDNAVPSFQALALDKEGRPIPVMNSDGVLELLLGEPPPTELASIYRLMMTKYPQGLKTDVGIVAANASLSGTNETSKLFDRNAYHGAVVWGWQQTAFVVGARRQERLLAISNDAPGSGPSTGSSAADQGLRMLDAAGDYANLELWTFGRPSNDGAAFPEPFNLGSGNDAEANPAQLWSAAAFAALVDERR